MSFLNKKCTILFILMILLSVGCEVSDERKSTTDDTTDSSTPAEEAEPTEDQEEPPLTDNDEQINDAKKEDNDDQEDNDAEQEAIETIVQRDENGLIIVPDPESITVVVNKERRLPDGYEPPDLVEPNVDFYAAEGDPKRQLRKEAADALEELFGIAEEEGLELVAVSGYRSYQRQKTIYNNSVKKNGEEHANQYSAKPGTSEHQTGLAMDVASSQLVSVLEPSFIETDEGQWLHDNAHRAGFIIRYPDGKENITGYNYEPWHLRYVGKELATEIYKQQLTLEEFFGLFNE